MDFTDLLELKQNDVLFPCFHHRDLLELCGYKGGQDSLSEYSIQSIRIFNPKSIQTLNI